MAQILAPVPRVLPSWIDGFLNYTEELASPELFRKWSAISLISAALERKVWVRSQGSNLYPTLYIILVGPPGVGKTIITSEIENFATALSELHVAPTNVTRAAIIDALSDAKRRILRPTETPAYAEFNSLYVISNELGVFLPSYDMDFMSTLTDIFDGKRYAERRRTKEHKLVIDHPQINILAGTTPSYLSGTLPDGAWDQGFTSRTFFVFSGDKVIRPLFSETTLDEGRRKILSSDLASISNLFGAMTFEPDAASAISKWHMSGGEPLPNHPKLTHYNSRRTAHLIKLCMIYSAACSSDKVITLAHFEKALESLIEVEIFMPDIFRSMTSGGDGRVIEDTWHYVFTIVAKEKKPMTEHRIVEFLSQRTPAYNVMNILNIMVNAGHLKKELASSGLTVYKPMPRT